MLPSSHRRKLCAWPHVVFVSPSAGIAQWPTVASEPPWAFLLYQPLEVPQTTLAFLSTPSLDMPLVAVNQSSCLEVASLVDFRSLRVSKATFGDLQLLCDLSIGSPRPLHPPAFRVIASTAVHSLAHPGIWATKRLIDICALNLDHHSVRCCQLVQILPALPAPLFNPSPFLSGDSHKDLVDFLPCSSEGYITFSQLSTIPSDGLRSSPWPAPPPLLMCSSAVG